MANIQDIVGYEDFSIQRIINPKLHYFASRHNKKTIYFPIMLSDKEEMKFYVENFYNPIMEKYSLSTIKSEKDISHFIREELVENIGLLDISNINKIQYYRAEPCWFSADFDDKTDVYIIFILDKHVENKNNSDKDYYWKTCNELFLSTDTSIFYCYQKALFLLENVVNFSFD